MVSPQRWGRSDWEQFSHSCECPKKNPSFDGKKFQLLIENDGNITIEANELISQR